MERQIVIVVPTFNEEENISAFLNKLPKDLDVVIADSHSTDKTAQIIKKFRSRHIHYLDVKKRGLGLGLILGLDYAVSKLKADILVTMEADLSCDPKKIPNFLKQLNTADLVLGSRYIRGGQIKNWTWWRRMLSRCANLTLMLFAGTTKTHEFTNLYRAFTKEAWFQIRPSVLNHQGWLFVPAFVFVALEKNVTMIEEPIVYVDRFGGRSKMQTVSYTKNIILYALKYRLKNYYGSNT